MTQAQPSFSTDPLFVELAGVGLRHVFELEASAERVFVVGSSRQADVRLDGPGIAAVEFHVERVGDTVWVTPAHRGRGLRVNGVLTQERVEVSTRLLLRLGAWDLDLKVLPNASDTEPSTRSSSAPRPLPGDYFESVPTDTAATSVALQPVEAAPPYLAATTRLPVTRAPMFALPAQQTERLAPLASPMFPTLQQTQRIPRFEATKAPSQAVSVALLQTVRLEPVAAAPGTLSPSAPPTESASQATTQTPQSSLLTQDTTSFDVTALRTAPEQPHATMAAPSALEAPSAAASTELPALITVTPRPRVVENWKTVLTQLGITTKQRPVLVIGGALATSLVLALALVGATRLPAPTVAKAPRTSPSASVTRFATSLSAVASAQASQPSMIVVTTPTPAEKPAPGPRAAKHPETLVLTAVRHASAGRLAEAAEAYRALGSGPDGIVYATLAAVLARRANGACANAVAKDGACPEILQ